MTNTAAISPIVSPAPRNEEIRVQPPNQVVNSSSSTDQRRRYFTKCVLLHHAAMKGKWREAKKIILEDPATFCTEPINKNNETLLHIAAGAGQTHFVRKLLELPQINYDSLTKRDKKDRTPFCRAVTAGAKEIVDLMLSYNTMGTGETTHNAGLLTMRALRNSPILYYAAQYGRGEMANFLYDMPETRDNLSSQDLEHVFFACLDSGLYDVALKLLDNERGLAVARHFREPRYTALHILARNPSAFISHATRFSMRIFSESKQANVVSLAKSLWDSVIMDDNKLALINEPTHLLFDAVKSGNLQLLEMLINSDPDLVWEENAEEQTIFHVAVKYRRADIFNLMHEMGQLKDVINSYEDKPNKNNMLHLAAKLPPPNRLNAIPGAALQMQQEMLWYKEVKKIMDPELRDKPNRDPKHPQTPEELFIAEHEALLKDAEKWMNDRAQSCTIVATLIATVVFATAFTVPGGNDQDKGSAMFLAKKNSTLPFLKKNPYIFHMFAISAAIALGASTMSIIIFLSILTSRYSYKEFLQSLPRKLMMGLFTLLISMIGMMFSFCIAFMLAYAEESKMIPWVIIGIQVLPIVSFVVLQGPLFYQVFRSTYFSKLLFPPREVQL